MINPWRTIFEAIETIYRGLTERPDISLRLPYPAALGVWPAFALLLAFSWIELVYPNPAVPQFIAWLAIAYSILTFAGMFLFGCETWLRHGEVFTPAVRHFRALCADSSCAPDRSAACGCGPTVPGCSTARSVSTSMMAFVLLLLSTVLYDGALGTPEWGAIESALALISPRWAISNSSRSERPG